MDFLRRPAALTPPRVGSCRRARSRRFISGHFLIPPLVFGVARRADTIAISRGSLIGCYGPRFPRNSAIGRNLAFVLCVKLKSGLGMRGRVLRLFLSLFPFLSPPSSLSLSGLQSIRYLRSFYCFRYRFFQTERINDFGNFVRHVDLFLICDFSRLYHLSFVLSKTSSRFSLRQPALRPHATEISSRVKSGSEEGDHFVVVQVAQRLDH